MKLIYILQKGAPKGSYHYCLEIVTKGVKKVERRGVTQNLSNNKIVAKHQSD